VIIECKITLGVHAQKDSMKTQLETTLTVSLATINALNVFHPQPIVLSVKEIDKILQLVIAL
jgi:predicted component of type VI protein secretion system